MSFETSEIFAGNLEEKRDKISAEILKQRISPVKRGFKISDPILQPLFFNPGPYERGKVPKVLIVDQN